MSCVWTGAKKKTERKSCEESQHSRINRILRRRLNPLSLGIETTFFSAFALARIVTYPSGGMIMSVQALTAARLATPLASEALSAVDAGGSAVADKIRDAAQDFESLFLSEILKQMRQNLEPGGLFGKDGGDIYGGLFDFFMGKHLAQAGGVGIASYIQRQVQNEPPR
jgi:flagellar protein FlgJ